MVKQEEKRILQNMKKILKDLKERIISNWIFILIALVVFFSLIFINDVFNYDSYLLNINMGPKKVCLLLGVIFVCMMALAIYGINKKTVKEDALFLLFSVLLGVVTCALIIVYAKMDTFIFIDLFKEKIGIITFLLTIILGTIYYFIFKNLKNIKPETVFLLIAIPIGLMYCMVTPLGRVPDEITHSEKAIDISHGNFLSKANENGEAELTYTESLEKIFHEYNTNYTDYLEIVKRETSSKEVVYKFSNMALYSPICHLPQATGMLIARILNANLIVELYAGRIVNLLVAIALIYFAVKYIPFSKMLIILIALLPISMQELASLSSDALTISISLFYISYILHLRYNDNIKEVTKKDWFILIISTIVVSMVKIVYLPLCLLLFLIPESKLKSRKNKILKLGFLFVLAVVLNLIWLVFSSRFLIAYNVGVDSKEQVLFILKHPIEYSLIMIRTILMFAQNWWMGLVGSDLAIWGLELEVIDITYIAEFSLSVILLMLFFINENKEVKIDKTTKIVCGIAFLAIILLIFTSLFVQFNRVANTQISGIQPRYFIPLLILIPIFCNNKTLVFNKKIDYKYLYMYIIFLSIHTLSIIINTYII